MNKFFLVYMYIKHILEYACALILLLLFGRMLKRIKRWWISALNIVFKYVRVWNAASTARFCSVLYCTAGWYFLCLVSTIPLPLRKFRKNSISAVRITLLTWKILLRRWRSSCRCAVTAVVSNRIKSYFCRCHSSVAGQPISVLVIVQTLSMERCFHQFCSHVQRQQ